MGVLARTVKRVVRLFGYRINRAPRNTSSLHEEVLPFATLAPWNTDAKFAAAYSVIRNFTLVDKYRCFELWQLTAQVAKLPQGAILEVGVWRGGTGALSARQAADCKIIEMVYLCDTFTGVVKASKRDHTYQGGEHSDTSRRVAEKLTTSMGLGNTRILQGIFPEDTGHEVEQVSFRLCHIDVDVYESARNVNEWIWDRLVPGGLVIYDDYGFEACDGVTRYVDEQRAKHDRCVFHNLNGHAVVVKL